MIEYALKYPEKLLGALFEHLWLVGFTLILSLVLASLLTVLAVTFGILERSLVHVFSVIYSIPSLALFALLIPVTGLGQKTALTVLVLYNQYLLLRNFLAGLSGVDSAVMEAAAGIGMTRLQILWDIQIPLAQKALFTGLRLALISTTGIATIAAAVNAGGLGTILFDGLRTMNTVKILWGTVLSAGLVFFFNVVLGWIEKRIS